MGPEVKQRLFDPFFTTKGKAGMGLGLAVSFGIIRRHEGSIEVESEPGAGTKFCISLPKSKVADAISETKAETSIPHPQTAIARDGRLFEEHKANILVVDDEESVRELLRDL